MKKIDINKRLDQIIEFSGIEDIIPLSPLTIWFTSLSSPTHIKTTSQSSEASAGVLHHSGIKIPLRSLYVNKRAPRNINNAVTKTNTKLKLIIFFCASLIDLHVP